jgi:hypothetical protein
LWFINMQTVNRFKSNMSVATASGWRQLRMVAVHAIGGKIGRSLR